MDLTAYLLLLLVVAIGVAGQLLLKQGMSRQVGFRLREVLTLARNMPVVAGFAFYGLSTLLYFKVLAQLDLSLAYPTISLGYVLVIILSKVFFGESVSRTGWAAVVIICTGVAMVGFGAG